ncbi:unnamed protein product [Camellia sinensis]
MKKFARFPEDEVLKLWLFLAYVISFVSLAAAVGLLIQDALVETGPSAWTGTAGVLQCVFVLIRWVDLLDFSFGVGVNWDVIVAAEIIILGLSMQRHVMIRLKGVVLSSEAPYSLFVFYSINQ